MATPAQLEHSGQAAPGQGGPPGGPPGFGGLPAYLAQRLSPSPAQKPAELPDQAGPHHPRATSNSPVQASNHRARQNSHQHLPAGAYDALSDGSSDGEPPGFGRATNPAGQPGQACAAASNELTNPKNSTHPPGPKPPGAGPPGYGSSNGAPTDNNGINQVRLLFSMIAFLQPACVQQCGKPTCSRCRPVCAHLHTVSVPEPFLAVATAVCLAKKGFKLWEAVRYCMHYCQRHSFR